MRVTLRPTVAGDLAQLVAEPLPYRIKALTAVLPGAAPHETILGVGGLGFRPDGTVIAFVHMTDAARKYPAAIHRAGLQAMAMIRASRIPMVIAEADPDVGVAARWLERLGFRRMTIAGHGTDQVAYVWESARDVE